MTISETSGFSKISQNNENDHKNNNLFELFWSKVLELIKNRDSMSISSILSLMYAMMALAYNSYPNDLEYIDNILGFVKDTLIDADEKSY